MSELASSEVVELLDADTTVEKRASWEAFEFTLLEDGAVEVVNASHEEPEEHTYTVHVEGGIPSDCTCLAFEYQEGPCKHQVAVAIREPVLEAATAEPTLKADGGVTVEIKRATTPMSDQTTATIARSSRSYPVGRVIGMVLRNRTWILWTTNELYSGGLLAIMFSFHIVIVNCTISIISAGDTF